jgi:hypothetical protein
MMQSQPGGGLSKPRRIGSIEIDQDIAFQERSWRVQRAAWSAMVLIIAAALLGAFGHGPLSSARAGDENLLRIEYERFVRLESPEKITFTVGRSASRPDSTVELWVDRQWLSEHEVRSIVPDPYETRLTTDRVVYQFRVDSAAFPSRIEFNLDTRGVGALRGSAGISGSAPVKFSQFAYP